jgi:hypothetical protein
VAKRSLAGNVEPRAGERSVLHGYRDALRRQWNGSSRPVRLGWVVTAVVAVVLVADLFLRSAPVTYAGSFVATGSMSTSRAGATATLLADGRVLVAGGAADSGSPSVLASAELYDPARGVFAPTGSMAAPRANATATLLDDGRVLIAGGMGNDNLSLASAELYDPKTGTFDTTGAMATARTFNSMTLLADGRVLLAGGSDGHDRDLASAEIYDPTTGTFVPSGSLAIGREGAAAALLPDGRVLIAGGAVSVNASTGTFTSSAEVYDPQSGTFAPTGVMPQALEWRSATLLINGKVLVAGGRALGDQLNGSVAAELYDPETGLFTPTGVLRNPRVRPSAIELFDGRVLIAEGPAPAELYDPIQGTFSPTASMVEPRSVTTATLLANGEVLFAGGELGTGTLASAELFR